MKPPTVEEDKRWSNSRKKMEEEDSLRTLECLRGRLLAERQASRAAKDDAQQMENKLVQIESQLREESKLKEKAEKKLKFLMKKLESLTISPTLLEDASEKSSSSDNVISHSCTSSTSGTNSGIRETEEAELKPRNLIPGMSRDVKDNAISSNQNHFSFCEESSSTQDPSGSNSLHNLKSSPPAKSSHEFTPISQDSNTNEHSSSSLKDSEATDARNEGDNNEEDHYVDNSMALVPVSRPLSESPAKTRELKIVNKSVSEVLDALRHARENIQCSMERRHMIRVGPA